MTEAATPRLSLVTQVPGQVRQSLVHWLGFRGGELEFFLDRVYPEAAAAKMDRKHAVPVLGSTMPRLPRLIVNAASAVPASCPPYPGLID